MSGPFQQVPVGGGRVVDLYLLRFDADGTLQSPRAAEHLRDNIGRYSEAYLFSHGWNNTFDDALGHYRHFITGYAAQGVPDPAARPVLVGVIWPSTSFLWPWEHGPRIAADGDPHVEELRRMVAGSLDATGAARLSELVDGRTGLAADEATEAAGLVRGGLLTGTDPEDGTAVPAVEEILEAWTLLEGGSVARPGPPPGQFGDIGGGAATAAPQAAGNALDPRNLLRMGTVWKMKDRAGTVGAHGVGPVLRGLLAASDSSVPLHLIGHSFGARVLMSALAIGPVPRPVRSLLLLQPAVNRWCFAPDVVGTGRAGGYHVVLSPERVEQPILSTFSTHDFPLHDAFHLAVRGSSLGEPKIAAVGDTFRFGALGGYGPEGLGGAATVRPAVRPGTDGYRVDGAVRVVAVDGSGHLDGAPAVGGHSEVSTPVTWWALRCLAGHTQLV